MSNPQKNPITIYEFSRAFEKVKDEKGNFVSGGYCTDKDFDGSTTKKIPENLKKIVTMIALDDNYAPNDESVALIAFEDEKYALLSVATSIDDNRGSRPTIAYRYFWLSKNKIKYENFDGIRTLVSWWYDKDQPEFNWYEKLESSFYQTPAYSKKSDENREEQSTTFPESKYKEEFDNLTRQWQIVRIKHKQRSETKKLPPSLPQVRICQQDSDNILDFHQQAINLQQEVNKFNYLIWAYGVKRLKNPKQFTLIACSDEDSKIWTEKNSLSNQNSTTIQQRSLEDQEIINEVTEKVKKLLMKIKNDTSNKIFAKNSITSEFRDLVTILQTLPNRKWEWSDIRNTQNYSAFNNPTQLSARDMSLLGLFKPEGLLLWLNWLYDQPSNSRNLLNQYPNKRFATECLTLHNIIYAKIESLYSYPEIQQIYPELQKHFRLEISHILNQLRSNFDESYFAQVKWLLIDSNSIWSSFFKRYTNYTSEVLIGEREKIEGDEFINYLEKIRDERKKSNQNSENLAYILDNSDSYAQLYDLVGSPESQFLAKKFKQWGRKKMPKKSFFTEHLLEIILGITLLFLTFSPFALIIYQDSSRNRESDYRKELTIDDNLEKQFYLQLENKKISKSSRGKTIGLLKKLTEQIQTSQTKKNKDYLQNPTYQTIKKLFLPITPEKLEITMVNKSSRENDVDTLISLLQKDGTIESGFPRFSEDSEIKLKEAVKTFQTTQQIDETGIVDKATWESLFEESLKVLQVSNILINLYQENNNYEKTLDAIERLRKCQDETLDEYDQCLNTFNLYN